VRSDVLIAVRPSLFAMEGGERRLIFLELREQPRRAAMRIIAQLAFEAFRPVLWNLAPRAVQVVDVRRGSVIELQQSGDGICRDLAEACKTISQLWPALAPRGGTPHDARPTERQMAIPWDFEA
jgi:hypothetical protein